LELGGPPGEVDMGELSRGERLQIMLT